LSKDQPNGPKPHHSLDPVASNFSLSVILSWSKDDGVGEMRLVVNVVGTPLLFGGSFDKVRMTEGESDSLTRKR
jgi:hypothetical protein